MTTEFDLELRLRDFLAPFAEEAGHEMTDQPWISGFADWRFGWTPTPVLLAALHDAHPFPDSLAAVWAEYRGWQKLQEDRTQSLPDYELPPHVAARMAGLEFLMDTMPDASAAGIAARLAWLSHLAALDHYRTTAEDTAFASRLATDFHEFATAIQSAQSENPSPVGVDRRTQADRRGEVLSILRRSPELADREIGRRVGVSPQTVSNLRKKLTNRCPA